MLPLELIKFRKVYDKEYRFYFNEHYILNVNSIRNFTLLSNPYIKRKERIDSFNIMVDDLIRKIGEECWEALYF